MPTEFLTLFIGFSAGFIGFMVGWQINLVSIHRGIDRGRTAAFAVGMGAAFADLVFLLIGFTGLHPFTNHPELWGHLKWITVGMLFLVAYRTYIRKKSRNSLAVGKRNPAKNMLLGFLIVVSNPLAFFLWLAVLSFLVSHFPAVRILQNRWIFLAGFAAGAVLWFTFICLWVLSHARKWNEERLHLLSRLTAVGLALAALVLAFAKV